MFVLQFPMHYQQTHCDQEDGKQRKAKNLKQLPSDLPEPTLAAFVERDRFRHDSLPSIRRSGQPKSAAPIALEVTERAAGQKLKVTLAVSARGVT